MKKTISLAGSLLMLLAGVSSADDITMMAEQELDRLGYATGPVDGEETLETTSRSRNSRLRTTLLLPARFLLISCAR